MRDQPAPLRVPGVAGTLSSSLLSIHDQLRKSS